MSKDIEVAWIKGRGAFCRGGRVQAGGGSWHGEQYLLCSTSNGAEAHFVRAAEPQPPAPSQATGTSAEVDSREQP